MFLHSSVDWPTLPDPTARYDSTKVWWTRHKEHQRVPEVRKMRWWVNQEQGIAVATLEAERSRKPRKPCSTRRNSSTESSSRWIDQAPYSGENRKIHQHLSLIGSHICPGGTNNIQHLQAKLAWHQLTNYMTFCGVTNCWFSIESTFQNMTLCDLFPGFSYSNVEEKGGQ